jgi:hypothetical protein
MHFFMLSTILVSLACTEQKSWPFALASFFERGFAKSGQSNEMSLLKFFRRSIEQFDRIDRIEGHLAGLKTLFEGLFTGSFPDTEKPVICEITVSLFPGEAG